MCGLCPAQDCPAVCVHFRQRLMRVGFLLGKPVHNSWL